MHGFGAEGSDWQATANRLGQELTITPRIPTLPWREEFPSQANEMTAQLWQMPGALDLPPILVGHSNGGIVSREWSQTHPVSAIVTLGTPHTGVPLVYHAPELVGYFLSFLATLERWPGFAVPWELEWVVQAVGVFTQFFHAIAADTIREFAGTFLFGFAGGSVTQQMLPNSPYLRNDLNDVANLNRETAEIPTKVGIVNVARNYALGAPVRAFWPEGGDFAAYMIYTGSFVLELTAIDVLASSDPLDPDAQELYMKLLFIAGLLRTIDPVWCAAVSSNFPLFMGKCHPNDTIVPIDVQDTRSRAPTVSIRSGQSTPGRETSSTITSISH